MVWKEIVHIDRAHHVQLGAENQDQRNNFSKEEAISRLNAQNPQEEKIKLADFVIENNNSLAELKFNVEKILNLLH